jgi:hypothetical protein
MRFFLALLALTTLLIYAADAYAVSSSGSHGRSGSIHHSGSIHVTVHHTKTSGYVSLAAIADARRDRIRAERDRRLVWSQAWQMRERLRRELRQQEQEKIERSNKAVIEWDEYMRESDAYRATIGAKIEARDAKLLAKRQAYIRKQANIGSTK